MFLSHFSKSIFPITSVVGLVTISHLILPNSVTAFSVTFDGSVDGNGSFESPIAGSQNKWNTTGDVTTTGTIDDISPTNLANQAIITTGYIEGNYAQPVGNRNDDTSLTFNQSGTNPVNSDTNIHALQDHLSLSPEALSIPRVGGTLASTPRTSKEGSGMYQEFEVTLDTGETGFIVEFDWSYLTNDEPTTLGGEQDFGFWSLGQINGSTYTSAFNGTNTGNPNDEIIVLKSSGEPIINPPTVDNDYGRTYDYATNTRYSYSVDGLTAGNYTYRVGFGVVDVDGLDNSSALLIDNFDVQAVPFEFSPGLGLLLSGAFFGSLHLRKLRKNSAIKIQKM